MYDYYMQISSPRIFDMYYWEEVEQKQSKHGRHATNSCEMANQPMHVRVSVHVCLLFAPWAWRLFITIIYTDFPDRKSREGWTNQWPDRQMDAPSCRVSFFN